MLCFIGLHTGEIELPQSADREQTETNIAIARGQIEGTFCQSNSLLFEPHSLIFKRYICLKKSRVIRFCIYVCKYIANRNHVYRQKIYHL